MVAYHQIKIKALRAEGLVKPDSWFFKSVDPYLELWFNGESYATNVAEDSASPVFDHTFEMKSHEGSNKTECKEIIFRVLDKYAINCFTEPLGEARVSPASLCQGPLTLLLKEPGEDIQSPATVGKLYLVVESDGSAVMPELAVIATIKKTHPQNPMAKFWSEKYYYSLGPEERKRLLACCKSGYENPESEVGIHVVKPEDEKEFKEYFEKVYEEVDAIAAEKQRLAEAKKKEAENNEETKAARAAQVAAEARAAEEARLKMERHAAEEEKNAAERKLAARRAEIEKQVAELRRNAEEKARAVKKAAEEREVAQKKAAMEKAMVEATYMVEGAAKAKREAELKAQEQAEMAVQRAREEEERKERQAREDAEAAERTSKEEKLTTERKAAKDAKAREKEVADAFISKATGAKKAADDKAKADQALLEAKMTLNRVNLGAKEFISKNDETWKPPTVSAVQAAAERAKAEQAALEAKVAKERANADKAKTFISKNDETKSPAVLNTLRSPLPPPKPFPTSVSPPPENVTPPPESTNLSQENVNPLPGSVSLLLETNGKVDWPALEADTDASTNKKNKKKGGKKQQEKIEVSE